MHPNFLILLIAMKIWMKSSDSVTQFPFTAIMRYYTVYLHFCLLGKLKALIIDTRAPSVLLTRLRNVLFKCLAVKLCLAGR